MNINLQLTLDRLGPVYKSGHPYYSLLLTVGFGDGADARVASAPSPNPPLLFVAAHGWIRRWRGRHAGQHHAVSATLELDHRGAEGGGRCPCDGGRSLRPGAGANARRIRCAEAAAAPGTGRPTRQE